MTQEQIAKMEQALSKMNELIESRKFEGCVKFFFSADGPEHQDKTFVEAMEKIGYEFTYCENETREQNFKSAAYHLRITIVSDLWSARRDEIRPGVGNDL